MNFAVAGGPRSRWVGPPIPAPLQSSDRGRSPSGRQKHYGAVELAGSGEQVYVNDVVRVTRKKYRSGTTTSQEQRHRLAQVQSMWEDILTGIYKFRARWLIHESDLAEEGLKRLQETRLASEPEEPSSICNMPTMSGNAKCRGDDVSIVAEEVFLTPKTEDFEIQLIANPITLSVPTSATTDIPAEWKGKTGPRLTHTYDKSTGEFAPLGGSDAILKRARARQSEAVAIAARADQEYEAAKNGKRISDSNGWLLPKGAVFGSRGKGKGAESRQRRTPSSSTSTTTDRGSSTTNTIGLDDESDDGKPKEAANSNDEEWKASDEHESETTDSDVDAVRRVPRRITRAVEASPRKSPRQRKSQQSPAQSPKVNAPTPKPPQNLPAPALSQRRSRAPATKRQGPLPPRPRRLSMPPTVDKLTSHAHHDGGAATVVATPFVAVAARPARTRAATGNLPRSCSVGSMVDVPRESSGPGKRKRSSVAGGTAKNSLSQSDYPPRRTPVGKDYQVNMPGLLSAEEKDTATAATGARMVWRSARDWDHHSRRMLDEYLNAAKEVVQAKQARPGVPVHVRLGGGDEGGDGDNMESTGSYAVWAVTAGRDACGVVRVACSEAAQTEVPRSAIQRVQSEEEALTALVKTRCILDNFEPALEMLSNNHASPPSIQPWTLMQVRTLEKVLQREFDPNRRLHGYARPGMDMDREDFIDLASVSKQVPGKTPAQVLSFYYRYLAAAEPLTDVVYGPEAAEARKQEEMSSVRDADVATVWNSRPARVGAHDTRPRPVAQKVSNGQHDTSSAGGTSDLVVTDQQQATKLLSRSTAQFGVAEGERGSGSEADDARQDVKPAPRDAISVKRDLGMPPCSRRDLTTPSSDDGAPQGDVTGPARDGSAPPWDGRFRPRDGNKHPDDGSTFAARGGGGSRGRVDDGRAVRRQESEAAGANLGARPMTGGGWRGVPGGDDGGKEEQVRQRRRAERETGVPKPLPPDAEVLEVDDSGDEAGADTNARGATRRFAPSAISAMSVPASSGPVAASRPNATGHGEVPWVARQIRRQQEATLAAARSQRSGVLPTPHHPASQGASSGVGGPRMARPAYVAIGFRTDTAGYQEDPRGGRWEQPQQPHIAQQGVYTRRADGHVDAGSGGRGGAGAGNGRFVARFEGDYDGGHASARHGHAGSASNERAPDVVVATEEAFGAMAPCWRLLERAKAYMDHDQLVYMRGLILTHVKKPMSRDQMLERAESCLREQEKIFAAFVKMYDRIEQPPLVPLYPATIRRPPQSTPYVARAPISAVPVHTDSPDPSHARVPPPRSLAVEVSAPASRYSVSSPIRGGVAAGGRGVSSPTMSSPGLNAVNNDKGRAEVRPHPMGLHAYGTGRRWVVKGNGYDNDGGGGGGIGGGASGQRVGLQLPSHHPSSPAPSSSVPTSRTTVSGEARRDQEYGSAAGGVRRAWGRADDDSRVVAFNKDVERGRGSAAPVPGYGGAPYGSRNPLVWRSGDTSVAAVAAAAEAARRGDGRTGSSWGNDGGSWT